MPGASTVGINPATGMTDLMPSPIKGAQRPFPAGPLDNSRTPTPPPVIPNSANPATQRGSLADRVFAQDPNGPDTVGDRFRQYARPVDAEGKPAPFRPVTDMQAHALQQATGYMPNVTVGGAFGQGPAQLTLKEKLKYGNAKEQAEAGKVVTERLLANKDGRHFGGAIPKTDPTTGKVYFASAPGAAAAAPEMDPAKIRDFAAERGLDLTPSGRGLMGPASPGNRPDAATLEANRAKYQAARAQTLNDRLSKVTANAAAGREDRQARARGPLQQAIFKRDQQVAAGQQLEKDKLAGAERMQGGELANRLAIANVQATAQREVAAADRDMKRAIADGDRKAAAEAQERLLAAQDKQNQATNALKKEELGILGGEKRLAAVIGGASQDEVDRNLPQPGIPGQPQPQVALNPQADPARLGLGGVATERHMEKLKALENDPEAVVKYMKTTMGLQGDALRLALNKYYSPNSWGRWLRTEENPHGNVFHSQTLGMSSVDSTGKMRPTILGKLLSLGTGMSDEQKRRQAETNRKLREINARSR